MGGFVALHHNKLRDIAGALLEQVYHDVPIEQILQPVADNNLVLSTANTNDGARLDVSPRIFLIMSQKSFLTSGYLTPTFHDTNPEVLKNFLQ